MKLFSFISSSVLLSSLTIFGFSDVQSKGLEGRITGLEKNHEASNDSHIKHQAAGKGASSDAHPHEPTDSHREHTEKKADTHPKIVLDFSRGCRSRNMPYFHLDFLWLRAIEDNISYAWRQGGSPGNDRTLNVKDQNFQFKPGLRVGVGYNFDYDGWDLHLAYTWHYTHVHSSMQRGNEAIISTLGVVPFNNGSSVLVSYARGKSDWQNQFNVWDLDIGRSYYVGKHLSAKPTVGLKAALIRQHLQAFMYNAHQPEAIQGQQPLVIPFENAFTRFKSRFWGIGPKLGALGEWRLGGGFSLVGNIHAAFLYGQFKTKNSIVARVVADRVNPGSNRVGNNEGGHIFDDFYRLKAMAYASLGVEWGRCFWDWLYFQMHLGWEGQYWWQQMALINFSNFSPDGDLSLTGVNANLRFDF